MIYLYRKKKENFPNQKGIIMRKPYRYMVFDCETATLPFVNSIASTPEEKTTIAIAKPLIYDAGWVITDRKGTIIEKKQFLIAETFSVPAIFDTAYYAGKRPIYLEMLNNGETIIKPWREVVTELIKDMETVDAVGAYNSMFDFKKAIPFTELYINKLYSPDYYAWENEQKKFCSFILTAPKKNSPNPDFEEDVFRFRGETYPLFDLWGLATKILLNNASYKRSCLEHDNLSASGLFFKTSAETTYQYICNMYNFVESHTALDDALIETFILSKIAARHAIDIGITFFPFRDLGETVDFVTRLKKPKADDCNKVLDAINAHLTTKNPGTAYYSKMANKITIINNYLLGI